MKISFNDQRKMIVKPSFISNDILATTRIIDKSLIINLQGKKGVKFMYEEKDNANLQELTIILCGNL